MADTNIFNTQLIDINSLEAFWRRIKGDIYILTEDINDVDNKLQNITTNYDGQINDLYNQVNGINNILGSININDYYTKTEIDNSVQIITTNYDGQINDLYNQVNGINNILGSININDYYTKTEVDSNFYTKTASDDKYISKTEFDIASEEKIYLSIFSDMVIYFRDYDGTILYTYLIPELTSMPKLPSRDGLICQGWNYDIDDMYVNGYDKLDVGATYITDDGKTRLYISITTTGTNIPIYFSQTISDGVTIDWGDGSVPQTISGAGDKNTTHTYNEIGDYIITLNPKSGCILGLGTSYSAGIGASSISSPTDTTRRLQKVEIGNNVSTSIGYQAFYYNYTSLSSIVIPNSVTSIDDHTFQKCSSLSSIVIPNSVTSIGIYAFSGCSSLSSIVIPNSVTYIADNAFAGCSSLSSIVIPNSVTYIKRYAFSSCSSLSSIVIPNSVTRIGHHAFANCTKMKYYDFSQHTNIPNLDNTNDILDNSNAFTGIPSDCKIIVPDSLYDSWIVASNWSTYASYIIKKSDWDAQQG